MSTLNNNFLMRVAGADSAMDLHRIREELEHAALAETERAEICTAINLKLTEITELTV